MPQQQTIKNTISAEGIGLHSGQLVHMTLKPAPVGSGVSFVRVDLDPQITLPITPENIEEAVMCTRLSVNGAHVSTIEHLMAALCALEIDNIIVEINADELPVLDGSASPFIFLLQSAGVQSQDKDRRFLKIKQTVRVELEDKYAQVEPNIKGLDFDYAIDFEHPVIAQTPQTIEYTFHPMTFIKEISRARTFGFADDLDKLHANNLAQGASLDNAVGISDDGVMNPDGLRYEDEFLKHKLLDTIGDLYVAGPLIAKFKGYKTSHTLNNQLIRKIFSDKNNYEWVC